MEECEAYFVNSESENHQKRNMRYNRITCLGQFTFGTLASFGIKHGTLLVEPSGLMYLKHIEKNFKSNVDDTVRNDAREKR